MIRGRSGMSFSKDIFYRVFTQVMLSSAARVSSVVSGSTIARGVCGCSTVRRLFSTLLVAEQRGGKLEKVNLRGYTSPYGHRPP